MGKEERVLLPYSILTVVVVVALGLWVGYSFCDLEREQVTQVGINDKLRAENSRLRVQVEFLVSEIEGAVIIRPLPIICGP